MVGCFWTCWDASTACHPIMRSHAVSLSRPLCACRCSCRCRCCQLEEDFIKCNPEWVKELELMLKTKEKAEIQALSSFGFQYLSQVYLPLKLQEGDWI